MIIPFSFLLIFSLPIAVFVLIVLGIMRLVQWRSGVKPKGLMGYKIGFSNALIIIVLFLLVLALEERILYDLTRIFVGDGLESYWDNLNTIFVHTLIILPVLVLSIFINVQVGDKKEKYAVVLIPYFIATIVLTLQLVAEISVYFYNHHTPLQLYLVLGTLVFVSSFAIYSIQKRFNPEIS